MQSESEAPDVREPDAVEPTHAARELERRVQPHPRITFVRHGEPDWAPAGGVTVDDPSLTPYGEAQAESVARALAGEAFAALYVSPYRRARETALPLASATGLEPVVYDPLAEIGVPFEGYSQQAVDQMFVEATRRPLHEHWDGWPGGESFHDFHARVTKGLLELLARHGIRPERRHDFTVWHFPPEPVSIAIVAHGGTNAVLLSYLLDVRPVPWEWVRFESVLAAYSIAQARPIGESGSIWSLHTFNEVRHLREARLL